jgi:hypothetical protein
MRTLIRELPYETPLAGGRYRYERGGQPTDAVESWRLSAAVDGYRFLRVDLNAQEAASGDNYLYHLVLGPQGMPERLNFRFFNRRLQIKGLLLFEGERVSLTRQVNGQRFEEETVLTPPYLFWFPASAGLSLLAQALPASGQPGLSLNSEADFALWNGPLSVQSGSPQTIEIMGRSLSTRPLHLEWGEEKRTIWLDDYNWPVQVQRRDLIAKETRYLRYGKGKDETHK